MLSPELKQLEDILLKAECLDTSDAVEDDEVGLVDNARDKEDGFPVDLIFKFKLCILDAAGGGGIGSTGFGRINFEEEASCTCTFPVARVTNLFISS